MDVQVVSHTEYRLHACTIKQVNDLASLRLQRVYLGVGRLVGSTIAEQIRGDDTVAT